MYFKQIDSLRFFAVLLVLCTHWLHTVPLVQQLKLGTIGVELFFVISGFLISLQLYKFKAAINANGNSLKSTLKNFYIRRVLRIFPLYYFILLLATFINKGELLDAFLWNLSCTTNFYFIQLQYWPGNFSQFWSLSVEDHFYIFWPLIVLMTNRENIIAWMVGIACFSVGFRVYSFYDSYDFMLLMIHTVSCLDLFMMGALLAYVYFYKPTFFIKASNNKYLKITILLAFSILFFVFVKMPQWELFNWVFQRFLMGVVYLCVLGFFVSGIKGRVGMLLENRLLIRLGKLSYGIYLIHNFVPGILLPIKALNVPLVVEFFLYFVVTIVLSEISYRFIENPVRDLNRFFIIKSAEIETKLVR